MPRYSFSPHRKPCGDDSSKPSFQHHYFGGMRIPVSTRMVSLFMYGLVIKSITMNASSSPSPIASDKALTDRSEL